MTGFLSGCWQVYSFLDKMSFYNELHKHKPHDVLSHEDGTLWRRQTPKLLYPLGKMCSAHPCFKGQLALMLAAFSHRSAHEALPRLLTPCWFTEC